MKVSAYIISCGLLALELCADTNTWQSPPPSGNWTITTNWSLGSVPTSATTAIFPDMSGDYTVNVNTAPQNANILQFTADNSTVTISGNALNLYTGITVSGASAPRISSNIAMMSNSSFAVNLSGANLTINGNITGSNGMTISEGNLFLGGEGFYPENTYFGITEVQYGANLSAGQNNCFSSNSRVLLKEGATMNCNDFTGLTVATLNTPLIGANNPDIPVVILGTSTLTLSSPSGTFYGVITGIGGLTLSGVGTLAIATPSSGSSDSNDYTGLTSITNYATLSVTNTNALSEESQISLGTYGQLSLSQNAKVGGLTSTDSTGSIQLGIKVLLVNLSGATSTFAGQITSNDSNLESPTNGLTLVGPGTLTLSGTSNNYSGTTSLNTGAILVGNAGSLSPKSIISLQDTSQLTVNGSNAIRDLGDDTAGQSKITLTTGTLTIQGRSGSAGPAGIYRGQITGSGSLAIKNPGTLIFNNSVASATNYQGTTTISNRANLTVQTSNSLSPQSSVILTTGALTIDLTAPNNATIKDLNADLNSQVDIVNSATNLILGSNSTTPAICAAYIYGEGGIIKQNSQTFQLVYSTNLGQNSYVGNTTITGGTLAAGSDDCFSPGSIITLTTGILDANVYNNAIPDLDGAVGTTISIGSGGVLTIGVTGQAGPIGSCLGRITGQGSFGITNTASYTLTPSPSAPNNYYGSTNITGDSTLIAGGNNAFSANSIVSIDSGSTLNVAGFNNQIAGLSGAGSVTSGSTSGSTLTIGGTNASSSFSGSITSIGTIGITKVGTGTLTLSGTSSNAYLGNTVISGGTLAAGNNNVFSTTSLVVLSSGATLDNHGYTNRIGNLTGSGGTVILGAGTLEIGTLSQTSAYGGTIVASLTGTTGGNLTLLSGTTFVFSGTSTYGGTTTVEENATFQAAAPGAFSPNSTFYIETTGTLDLNNYDNEIGALSSDAAPTSALVQLNSGSNLTMGGNGATTTYNGSIEGVGNVTQKTGKITFSNTNAYTGTTTITNGGTIVISDDNQLGDTDYGLFLSTGTLEVSLSGQTSARTVTLTGITNYFQVDAGTFTLSGAIGGSGGGFTKLGSETTLVLSNTGNNYTGITTVSQGTLQAGGGQTLSAGSEVSIASGATLDLNNNANQIANLSRQGNVILGNALLTVGNGNDRDYYGEISGTGGVKKVGLGTLTLWGNSTYTGATEVDAGTLVVNGQITSTTTVDAGATLRGTGQITGNVSCSGTTAPGNSIGTLTVTGNYTALSGSDFHVETDTTTADKLVATGSFTIDSNAALTVIPYRGLYSPKTPYIIVEAGRGVSGTFHPVITTITKATVDVDYSDPNKVILYLTVKSFSDIGLSWNAINVANALDQIMLIEPPGWEEELDTLFYLSESELNIALNQLDPAQLKGFSIIQQNNAVRVQNGISLRFQNFLDKMNCPRLRGCNFKRSPVYFWVDGFNSKLRQPSNLIDTNPQVGYRANTGGGSMGIDMNFLKHGFVGLMGAGTYSDVKWVKGQGTGHIKSAYAGVYASWLKEKQFANFSILGAASSYGAHRNIIYPGVYETAKSEHDGLQLLTHLDLGLNFKAFGVTCRPFESLDFIIQHEKAFQESNAHVYNLDVQKTNPQMFRNELGITFAKCYNISKKSRILADLKLSWVSENRMKGTLYTSSFINLDEITFQTKGYYPNRNFFSPGASLTGNFCKDSAYITVSYDAEIGNHYLDQRTGLQIGIKF